VTVVGMLTIDEDICQRCYQCVETCPEGALEGPEDGGPPTMPSVEACMLCQACRCVCPASAIEVELGVGVAE